MPKTPAELLDAAASTFRERNAVYGEPWINVGPALTALFPDGITIKDPKDQTRYHLFMLMLVKLSRYACSFNKGGHQDSIHDLAVYAAMLEHLDERTDL